VHYLPLNPSIPFMSFRNYRLHLSAFVGRRRRLMFVTDFNYGIDFRGGSMIEVQAKNGHADPADVRDRLSELNLGEVQVQEIRETTVADDPRAAAGRRRQRRTIRRQSRCAAKLAG
jgi:SecD/SecF fusion protein